MHNENGNRRLHTPEDGLQPLYTIIEVYYVIVGAVPSKVLPHPLESFWSEGLNVWKQEGYNYFYFVSLERMDRSPIENNTRPTLRGTSTCFRGSPGGWKVPTTYPPYPLFILVPLSSLRAVKTLMVCRGYWVDR